MTRLTGRGWIIPSPLAPVQRFRSPSSLFLARRTRLHASRRTIQFFTPARWLARFGKGQTHRRGDRSDSPTRRVSFRPEKTSSSSGAGRRSIADLNCPCHDSFRRVEELLIRNTSNFKAKREKFRIIRADMEESDASTSISFSRDRGSIRREMVRISGEG